MKTGALVAAAGLSSRMNCFKPLLPLGDSTLLRYGLRTLLTAGAFPVAVVTGREEAVIRASLDDLPVTCLYNPEYAACQMLRSVQLGLAWLNGRCDQVLFAPGDAPAYSVDTIRQLMACGAPLCRPTFHGKPGHPVLISAGLIPAILSYDGPDGLSGAMAACGSVAEQEVPDPGILLDADTPEEYQILSTYCREREAAL